MGDPAQTIYSFTGASPRHLLEFPTRHPKAQVVRLVRNYRSTPQIVGLANLVVRGPSGSMRSNAVQLQAQGADGPVPALTSHPDDPAEAAAVAAEIAKRVADGASPAEIAVLFRTNAQSEAFESALADAGRPLPRPRRRAVLLPQGGPRRDPAAARCGPLRRRVEAAARARPRRPARRRLDARGARPPVVPAASGGSR